MNKSKIIALALAAALCLTGCAGNGAESGENSADSNISTNVGSQAVQSDPAESTNPGSQGLSAPVVEFRINPDVISDLGLTYDQMVEKRGKLTSNTYKGVIFENGIGVYGWKSEGKSFFTDDYTDPGDLPNAGGCNWINGLKPEVLFEGLTYPVSMDILSDKYGFVPVNIGKEQGMDNCYWSTFTHPMYEDLEFIFSTDEYGTIDKDSGCTLSLDVDSLEAKPVIPTDPTVQTAAKPRILTEPLSDLGLTYEQMVEKRGEVLAESVKGIKFKNGLGMYGWKSDLASYTDYNKEGGCNWITGLKPEELFEGLTYPVSVYILSDKYGFVIGYEGGYDGSYWSVLTHPTYEDLEFIIDTKEPAIIDKDSGITLSLNKDSLDAKPVIQAENTPTNTYPRYGEVEIPEVGATEYFGKQENLLEAILFESYDVAGYTFKLIGENVGRVKGNDGIINCYLSVEVEKDGKIIEENGYNQLFTFVSAPSHEEIIEEKIGNYLDVYDLEVPVVAMKYYFQDGDPSAVDRAVEFSRLVDGELWGGLCICDKGTGLEYGKSDGNYLYPNEEDGKRCRINTFQADEFKIADKHTLIDEQAKLKFTFDLSIPPIENFYTVTAIS